MISFQLQNYHQHHWNWIWKKHSGILMALKSVLWLDDTFYKTIWSMDCQIGKVEMVLKHFGTKKRNGLSVPQQKLVQIHLMFVYQRMTMTFFLIRKFGLTLYSVIGSLKEIGGPLENGTILVFESFTLKMVSISIVWTNFQIRESW